jgi:hypothetical protein
MSDLIHRAVRYTLRNSARCFQMEYSSTISVTNNVIACSKSALERTLAGPERAKRINGLGKLASALERFVKRYLAIDDESINTGDEIFNWVYGETPTDLASAIWLLASGYYKASAASLRNALEIATAALYFQIRENEHTAAGFNRFYSEWDQGIRRTPNWGEMKSLICQQQAVVKFIARTGVDPVAATYEHFQYLCAYTHTSAFTPAGEPVTAINIGAGVAPAFHADAFDRGCQLTDKTMSMIAILWQVVFPRMAGPLRYGFEWLPEFEPLFPLPVGPLALGRGS